MRSLRGSVHVRMPSHVGFGAIHLVASVEVAVVRCAYRKEHIASKYSYLMKLTKAPTFCACVRIHMRYKGTRPKVDQYSIGYGVCEDLHTSRTVWSTCRSDSFSHRGYAFYPPKGYSETGKNWGLFV